MPRSPRSNRNTTRFSAVRMPRDAKTANLSSGAKQSRKGRRAASWASVRRHQNELKATVDERVQEAAARVEADAPRVAGHRGQRTPPAVHARPRAPAVAHRRRCRRDHMVGQRPGAHRIELNGCGKSTLQRIAGELSPRSGACTTHVSAAYLDQRLALLDPDRSIVAQLLLDTPLAEGDLRSRLALLQLDAVRATQPARQLSGGERLKAALAARCTPGCCCSTSRPITSISNRCGRSKPRWRDSRRDRGRVARPAFRGARPDARRQWHRADGATNPSRD